jgi:hypothetical protein
MHADTVRNIRETKEKCSAIAHHLCMNFLVALFVRKMHMHKCFCILIEISPITLNLLDTSFFIFLLYIYATIFLVFSQITFFAWGF